MKTHQSQNYVLHMIPNWKFLSNLVKQFNIQFFLIVNCGTNNLTFMLGNKSNVSKIIENAPTI